MRGRERENGEGIKRGRNRMRRSQERRRTTERESRSLGAKEEEEEGIELRLVYNMKLVHMLPLYHTTSHISRSCSQYLY